MKPIYFLPFFSFLLLVSSGANAAGSMLRITCGDSNNGAEVLVNGKFKGECPLDIQVPEGNVQLILRKKQDESIQKVFKTGFRIGDGVIKKVEVPDIGWVIALTDEALQNAGKSFAADLKAAKSGDTKAMNNLGFLYENGAGVAKNVGEAISWYTKAAEAGDAGAMKSLGIMYGGTGNDVPKNIEKSYFWLRKAIALGNKAAETYMAALQNLEAAKAERKALDESH